MKKLVLIASMFVVLCASFSCLGCMGRTDVVVDTMDVEEDTLVIDTVSVDSCVE